MGAGPTGVELAGQIRELAVRSLRGEFRSFEASSVRVVLLDGGKEPLATFGDQLSGKAAKELERLGVELRMGARVVGVDATGVDITDAAGNASRLATYTTVWAAGVEASPLAAELAKATGAELDRAGRIAVLPDLTLPGHPEVFVVGDMMALDKLPGVAEVAMQGGLHAANTIVRRLKGEPPNPFKYRDLGSAATIGRFRSVVDFHGLRLSGFPGWVVWAFVHLSLPDRVRQPADHPAQMDPFLYRPGSTRARVQRHAHRRRPQPARRGASRRPAQPAAGLPSALGPGRRTGLPVDRRRPAEIGSSRGLA